ncbi:DUF2384 domain-containing protein [Mycolicibacterium boenickei]|jgi:hypothetical protein|uniref:Protein of uncharacterized function (DUF2384) n=2 Tax=Mycolicibacterium TaxID=1866885 RepID=A0A378WBX2_MYCFO|nr:antitoxin Xre/MbcA/ParS toxin-binding domain-containing protein [Mycolicibacterium boenickei]PEG62514.1 DUF2384 domain-containing protein [Mycolicibacterium boenickei]UNB98498.1 DUF2384 domain-containing protein [Mycolicibacterium boenickei]BBX94313.1 hypothetical protein MBOE_59620 [Mycolicibacterium boenickei]SUA31305.1 Protein of uncharacterised function (DUF2384) [Mycolicibacterium fortuitum]
MADLLVKAADDTARMKTHEVVAYLLERLGRTAVAYMAGSKSLAMPARWASVPGDAGHAEPSPEKARRLKAAHAAFRSIEDAEDDQVARSWLLSANPRLDGRTPAQLVREDQIPAVFRAAGAFLTDTYQS